MPLLIDPALDGRTTLDALRNIKNYDALYAFIQDYPIEDVIECYDTIARLSDSAALLQQVFDSTFEDYPIDDWSSPIRTLASNRNLPTELAWKLYDLDDLDVDWKLSLNSAIPDEVAESLIDRYQNEKSGLQHSAYIVAHCRAILRGDDPFLAKTT